MDLSLLRDNLPASSSLAQADRELVANFKAAALSITTLYKSSQNNSKRAYNAGYAACLADVLGFIQTGLSAAESNHAVPDGGGALGLVNMNIEVDGRGMNIGRVMDYLEARLETVRVEEEEDEEERQKAGTRPSPPSTAPVRPHPTSSATTAPVTSTSSTAPPPSRPDQPSRQPSAAQVPTPAIANPANRTSLPSSSANVPSAPPPTSSPQTPCSEPPTSHGSLGRSRSKSRHHLGKNKNKEKDDPFAFTFAPASAPHTNTPVGYTSPADTTHSTDHPHSTPPARDEHLDSVFPLILPSEFMNVSIGSKRRHAQAMAMANMHNHPVSEFGPAEGGPSTSRPVSGSTRRRTRAATGANRAGTGATVPQQPSQAMQEDSMDVEEEPARKRVARR